jgi:hypothetical protein
VSQSATFVGRGLRLAEPQLGGVQGVVADPLARLHDPALP